MSPLRKLATILEAPARVRAVSHRLERLGSGGFVAALDELARDAALGATSADTDAMLACALWLLAGDLAGGGIEAELLAAARAGNHEVALALLDDGPAHKALAPKGRLPDHAGPIQFVRFAKEYHPTAREVAEAVEPMKAMTTEPWMLEAYDRAKDYILTKEDKYPAQGYWSKVPVPPMDIDRQLEHLVRRPDIESIARVLNNRDTAKKHVIRLAARRPTTPAIVAELVAHTEWMAHLDVRNAVVENPFTPLRTALLLLPTCRARLPTIASRKADVHSRVVAAARLLLSTR